MNTFFENKRRIGLHIDGFEEIFDPEVKFQKIADCLEKYFSAINDLSREINHLRKDSGTHSEGVIELLTYVYDDRFTEEEFERMLRKMTRKEKDRLDRRRLVVLNNTAFKDIKDRLLAEHIFVRGYLSALARSMLDD